MARGMLCSVLEFSLGLRQLSNPGLRSDTPLSRGGCRGLGAAVSLVSSPSPAFALLPPGAFVDSANPLCLSTAWDFERLACSLGRALGVCRWTTAGAFGMRSGLRTGVRVGLQSGLCPPSLPYRFPYAARAPAHRAPDALPTPRRRFALMTRLSCHTAHGSPAVPSPSAGLRVSAPASHHTRRPC